MRGRGGDRGRGEEAEVFCQVLLCFGKRRYGVHTHQAGSCSAPPLTEVRIGHGTAGLDVDPTSCAAITFLQGRILPLQQPLPCGAQKREGKLHTAQPPRTFWLLRERPFPTCRLHRMPPKPRFSRPLRDWKNVVSPTFAPLSFG